MEATHVLSADFMRDLESESGKLSPLLVAIRQDETLMLGLRNGYVSLYYRGGQLLRIRARDDGRYGIDFDRRYDPDGSLPARLQRHGDAGVLDTPIASAGDAQALVEVFGELKGLMDRHPKIRNGHEREFQQLVARENNRTRSAGNSHYFITDMEHASGDARFDMLGVRWRHDERKRGDCLVPVLFEMKYGDSALDGAAGMVKHLQDVLKNLRRPEFVSGLQKNVAMQFHQLSRLGLIRFNRSDSVTSFATVEDRVQVVFVLAGYNPRSTRLKAILDTFRAIVADPAHACNVTVDVRIFHASFCGYAMHEETMLTLEAARAQLDAWHPATHTAHIEASTMA